MDGNRSCDEGRARPFPCHLTHRWSNGVSVNFNIGSGASNGAAPVSSVPRISIWCNRRNSLPAGTWAVSATLATLLACVGAACSVLELEESVSSSTALRLVGFLSRLSLLPLSLRSFLAALRTARSALLSEARRSFLAAFRAALSCSAAATTTASGEGMAPLAGGRWRGCEA